MSINVHVTGNPISIKRGKMVTADLDQCKKEFDKRRLIRLEQVRQQSKDIAEGLRNKVKKERKSQMKEIEEEGKRKLMNWQNRKLLELQTQYQEALKELGVAHKSAQAVDEAEEFFVEGELLNQEKAAQRGKTAGSKLHRDKFKEELDKARLNDRKKLVREIENARAEMVSTIPRRSKVNRKRRSHRETSISVSDSEDEFEDYDESDSESDDELSDIKETNEVESSSCSCAASSEVSWPAGEISKNKNRARGSETLRGTADVQKKKRYLAAKHVEEIPPDSVPPLHLVSDDSLSDYQVSKKPQVTSRKKYSSQPVATEKTRQASPTKIGAVSPKKTLPTSAVSPKKTRPVSPKKTGLASPEKSKPLSPRTSQSQRSSFEKAQQAYDTRISDRIRHRGVICDEEREIESTEAVRIPLVESRTDIRDFINSRRCHEDCLCCCGRRGYKKNSETDLGMENHGTQTIDNKLTQTSMKSQSIPSHTSVKLKSTEIESRQSQLLKENKKSHSPAKRQKKTVSPSKGDKKSKSPSKMASKIDRTSRLASEKSFPSGSKIPINPDSPSKMGSRIHVYDHPNRFSTEKIVPPNSFVEKIPVESLEFLSDPSSEGEKLEAVTKRERDAQIRGRKALEKERLRREYEEMLKKLPMLQKKERICEIYNDKPEYHMSEERLKEKERARQNNLENHYNRLFPNIKPAIVTLPKVNQTKEENSSEESSVYSLNVAEWDVDYQVPSKFSSQEIQNIIKEFIKIKPYDRRAKLKELLKNLKIQRDQLLSAFSALPKNDSLDELIKDLRSLDDPDVKRSKPSKSDRKRRKENEADTSIDSSQESSAKDVEDTAKEVPRKSPRKKAKTKTRPNVIILQNTSTQTTPKPLKENQKPESVITDNKPKDNICNKFHIPCDCNKENEDVTDDLCHIFIKLNEDDSPEVMVKAKDKEKTVKPVLSKHVTVGTQISPEAKKVHRKPRTRPRVSETTPSNEQSRTWKDQFSKNSISTTSTSYYSPPDFQKPKTSDQSSFYNLRSKPQQEELSSAFSSTKHHSTESIDLPPDPLKPFIKKLLSMSKVSIDDLSVSTSNVETPSQSIIEMESNVPKQNLRQMIDSFKSRIGDIAEGLSYTPDISPVPFNLSISSENSSIGLKETTIPTEKPNTSLESKEELVNQYAKVSDSVTKRIQALAKMIETLREEKVKILQSSKTRSFQDKDFSTSYMDLPDSKSGNTSKSSSLEEDEILRKLMEIDQSVLDRMGVRRQHLSKDEIDRSKDSNSKSRNTPSINATNQEFAERLQRLKTQETSFIPSKQSAFVPFLSDIPKLPKFEPQPDTGQLHKRPPPSKGLTVAKKFNGNISLVPHELSTIVEADSQVSTKLPSPETSEVNMNIPPLTIPDVRLETGSGKSKKSSKETSKSSSNDHKDQSTSNKDDNSKSSGDIFVSLLSSSSSGSKKKCDDSTCGAINLQHFSSSSSDDLETVEAMLRSIGMEWAIPTLYKTQEALALGSSSSSLDLSKKRSQSEDLSTNEINLRDYLKKHVLGKVSSSTMLSDTTLPPSFVGEHSELSGIQVANSSVDKSKQRTSTPINLSKSTSHSKAVFTDSDLSSIRPDTSKSKRKS